MGDRLSRLVSFEMLKLAAGAVILSPFIPLLFMGEEYGETAPFLYFVSHSDPGLIKAVQQGRKEEFADFRSIGEPTDPQAVETFQRSKLQHRLKLQGKHEVLFRFYRKLLRLRKTFVIYNKTREILSYESEQVLLIRLSGEERDVITLLHFDRTARSVILQWPSGEWLKELDSAENRWGGQGSTVPPIVSGHEETPLDLAPFSLLFFVVRKEA